MLPFTSNIQFALTFSMSQYEHTQDILEKV